MNMNWLDTSILIVLGIGAAFGAISGFIWQIARIITYGVAVYASMYLHEPVAGFLEGYMKGSSPLVPRIASYVVSFLGVYLVLFVITLLIEKAVKAAKLKPMDRLLGAGLGVVKAGLIGGAVLMGLAIYPQPQTEAAMGASTLAPILLNVMRAVIVAVPQQYKDELSASLERMKKAGLEKAGELAPGALPGSVPGAGPGGTGTPPPGSYPGQPPDYRPPAGAAPTKSPPKSGGTRPSTSPPGTDPAEEYDSMEDWSRQGNDSDARATPK